MRPYREIRAMRKNLERKLTHIFGMTRRRDAMLGDLYYSLRTEGTSAHAETLLMTLAHRYNRSEDVANCLMATVDHIDITEGPKRAYDLAYRMAMTAENGPVAMILSNKFSALKPQAELEPHIRMKAVKILDRIRVGAAEEGRWVTPTLLCFNHDGPRRRPADLTIRPINPYQFVDEMKR